MPSVWSHSRKVTEPTGSEDTGLCLFSADYPLGTKVRFSSGKFSVVEHEGLNTLGFWRKTKAKKRKGRNPVLSAPWHLWFSLVHFLFFLFFFSWLATMFTESWDECALNIGCLNVDFLYRKQAKRQIFRNWTGSKTFLTRRVNQIVMRKEIRQQLREQWSSCISIQERVKNTCPLC